MDDVLIAKIAELRSLSDHTLDVAEKLRLDRNNIDDKIDELMKTWTGPAATSYRSEWDEISEGSLELIKDLFYIAELIANAAIELDTQDSDSGQTFRKINL